MNKDKKIERLEQKLAKVLEENKKLNTSRLLAATRGLHFAYMQRRNAVFIRNPE